MKFIYVLMALLILSSFSCGTLNNSGNTKVENTMTENTITITGAVVIFGNEPRTQVGIVDRDNIAFAVFPSSTANELRLLQGHLIEFKVIVLDEPQIPGFRRTVTPVEWKILQ